jgi:hypothetical protein
VKAFIIVSEERVVELNIVSHQIFLDLYCKNANVN